MISREPTIERLAIARSLLLEPFGLDETHLSRALAEITARRVDDMRPRIQSIVDDSIDLGKHKLRFLETPHVHHWDSLMVVEETTGGLFPEVTAIDTVATTFPKSNFAIVDVDQTQEPVIARARPQRHSGPLARNEATACGLSAPAATASMAASMVVSAVTAAGLGDDQSFFRENFQRALRRQRRGHADRERVELTHGRVIARRAQARLIRRGTATGQGARRRRRLGRGRDRAHRRRRRPGRDERELRVRACADLAQAVLFTTSPLLMNAGDIERLGLEEGEEILPGIVLQSDGGVPVQRRNAREKLLMSAKPSAKASRFAPCRATVTKRAIAPVRR